LIEGRGYLLATPGTLHKKRLVILLVFVIIVFLLLLVRIGYWTFYKGEWLQSQAESQWTQDTAVAAERGSILDRNGNVLAQSASADTVLLRPKQVTEPDKVADSLAEILEMDRSTVYEKATDTSKSEIWLKRQITREQSEEIQALNLDGISFTTDVKRYYPNNDLLCQVIGFTSVDGEGLFGLEKQYDKYLAGKAGRTIAETDKNGRELAAGQEFNIESEDGYTVMMTVDAVIQSFLENACQEAYDASQAQAVQGIVMDPNSGEVLAMASIPGYDLNDPPRNETDTLETLSVNRVTADVYEPGGIFGSIVAAAALDSGSATADSLFDCNGAVTVNGQRIACWNQDGHGTQSLAQAVQDACIPSFVQMAAGMGSDTLYDYIHGFGFGEETGIDYISDQSGQVMEQKYLTDTDVALMGAGQDVGVTSLQMVNALSTVVNGGSLYQPRLVSELIDSDGNVVQQMEPALKRQVISAETSAQMKQILKDCVDTGVGKDVQIAGYEVGGIGGTVQKKDESGELMSGKTVSSFAAFAPADSPQYVVLILVDEPAAEPDSGNLIAAPYVKEVLEQTLRYGNVPPGEEGTAVETVTVPDVTGLDTETARSQIEALGLTCTAEESGTVTRQLPSPNEAVAKGTDVTLYTDVQEEEEATGSTEGMAVVPDVSGMTMIEARDTLAAAGFEIDIRSSGKAVRQTPAAGEYAEQGSQVTVYFKLDVTALPQGTQ
jgi:stage V sporulation protein D (sporulation-specific penicillin-binding protein)